MSKNGLLSEREVNRLRSKRDCLRHEVKNRTIWEMWEPPLKTEEELKKIRENQKEELEAIIKLLKENTAKKRTLTIDKKKNPWRY